MKTDSGRPPLGSLASGRLASGRLASGRRAARPGSGPGPGPKGLSHLSSLGRALLVIGAVMGPGLTLAASGAGLEAGTGTGAGAGLEAGLDVAMGEALFERLWTSAPASTQATDGLGPLFNARACSTCHPDGGRGVFRESTQERLKGRITGTGLVLRLGDARGRPDPVYGYQIQSQGLPGVPAEGGLLRRTDGAVTLHAAGYGPLAETTRSGGRLAPSLRGVGALARVPVEALQALADPDDADGDGLSGRLNYGHDADGWRVPGRFGWKAEHVSLRQQSAVALRNDLGLSNPYFPAHGGDCSAGQSACQAAPHGGSPAFDDLEVDGQMLDLIVAYVAALPPPPSPSMSDPAGLALFEQSGCAGCHRPTLPTSSGPPIAPYTDLLLHDMGERLADGIGAGEADGREWRTAPLWGLGSVSRYLHDGRATNLRQAIALHGGEAAAARAAFAALPASEQARLLAFLSAL